MSENSSSTETVPGVVTAEPLGTDPFAGIGDPDLFAANSEPAPTDPTETRLLAAETRLADCERRLDALHAVLSRHFPALA